MTDKKHEVSIKYKDFEYFMSFEFAREKEERIQNAQKAIANYKELAQGDEATALRFFEKAFNDEIPEIKNIALERSGYSRNIPANNNVEIK